MRKRVMLFAAPLCIVAIAASVAVASPSDAEQSRSPKLDKLHAERPIAATTRTAHASVPGEFEAQVKAIQDYVKFRQVTDYIRFRMIEDYLAYQAAIDAASQAPVATQSARPRGAGPRAGCSCRPGRHGPGALRAAGLSALGRRLLIP